MKIEQIYTGCLSHAAYYIESDGEAAIFDPLRDVKPYILKAVINDVTIKYVFETHFHADFVSGHLDLKKKTGALIVFGPTAKPNYPAIIAKDGETFTVGSCRIKAIHTPGHTMESTSYLIIDESGHEKGLITGDTLFIGDVGRPDLAQHVDKNLTEDKLARMLFHSLREKIMPLNDDLIVYPNHGAGSACGKMMSKQTTDTLGNQKRMNYALSLNLTEDEFVAEVLSGLTTPPQYFPKNVLLNINGYNPLDAIIQKGSRPLDPVGFEMVATTIKALILDTREASEFAKGFIPNSINIGFNGNLATWTGEMISDIKQEILLVTDPGKEEESMIRLSRVGYDNTIGYLEGGFDAWKKAGFEIDSVERISAADFEEKYFDHAPVLDIRKKSEFVSEHVVGAINIPLNQINEYLSEFPRQEPFVIYCGSGYRSMIAASLLKQRGFNNFKEVDGGFASIKNTAIPRTDYSVPKTML